MSHKLGCPPSPPSPFILDPLLTWTATPSNLGAISPSGFFTAGDEPGTATVTCRAANVAPATATLTIALLPLDLRDPAVHLSTAAGYALYDGGGASLNPYSSDAVAAGKGYLCTHSCLGYGDRTGDVFIAFDTPQSLVSFDVLGSLASTLCPPAGSGLYTLGTLRLHTTTGAVLALPLQVHGTPETFTGYGAGSDIGSHPRISLGGTINIAGHGLLTGIDIVAVPDWDFRDAEPGSDGTPTESEGTPWCHHWIGFQELTYRNFRVGPPPLDLDIDSNNDGTIHPDNSSESGTDDPIENDADKPGKIIQVNDGDVDGDGIPDFADGYAGSYGGTYDTSSGVHFVPLVLQVPSGIDLAQVRFRFNYEAAAITNDASAVQRSGNGTALDPYLYTVDSGFLRIWKVDGTGSRSVSDFIWSGQAYTAAELGLTAGTSLTLYVETVRPTATVEDRQIKVSVSLDGGATFPLHDEVLVSAIPTNIAADNNRDGLITFDGQDATTSTRPFLFWLNDNHDVWGGDDYQAAQAAGFGPLDSQSLFIGSMVDDQGNTVTDLAALKEVAQRDLEDFAQLGFRWYNPAEGYVTQFRVRLESETSPAMGIRLFVSGEDRDLPVGELSATAHVSKQWTIDQILNRVDWYGADLGHVSGVALEPGMAHTWDNQNWSGTFGQYTSIQSAGEHVFPLMFEGMGAGTGRLVFEVMHYDQVISSSTMHIELRPMSEMYDQFSVAYGPNVDQATGNFISSPSAFLPDAVPTTAVLLGTNLEWERIGSQSDDYFLYVHGWRMQRSERISFAESAYKRMFWSGYTGLFGFFDWPTQWTDDPMNDPGNFDRSEFLAWNSAAGLRDALELIRDGLMPPTGELSVMAHSMGNVVLGEALHGASGILVDTAIMSQAALSSHYFTARTDLLPSIYTEPEDVFCSSHIISHTDPAWTEYKGFPTSDAIGGLQPRLYDIGLHAGQILNYYNPDDYALASWKMDQAIKPTALRGLAYLSYAYAYMDFGNVELDGGSFWDYLEFLFGKETPPGFADTQYDFDSSTNTFYRVYMGWDSDEQEWEETSRVALNFDANAYEMFAFCASSIVAAVGSVQNMNGLSGVFSGGVNLKYDLPGTTVFNALNTGHSAQFVHSYLDVATYWRQLVEDIG